jgi:predicted nucleic acid-binding protein
MTFVDANYFVRAIVEPTPETLTQHETAKALFRAVARGEEEATTSEAVLAEVSFVLNSKRQYGLPPAEVAARLTPILALPSLSLPRGRTRLYLRALELWSERPRLGFVDALTAAEVEHTGIPLATFDRDFDGIPGITYWRPMPLDEPG